MSKSTCRLCDDGVLLIEVHGEMLHELRGHYGLATCCAQSTRYERHTIPLAYIMSPYTNPDPEVMEQRYDLVQHYEQLLTVKFPDALFYSPITHFHPIAIAHNLPRDIEYWRNKNACMIHRSQLGIVLRNAGWITSKGIRWERDLFKTLNTPYVYDDLNSEHEVVGQALHKLA